ncbi:MAG: hypothetical protein RLZZ276_131, partial [Pseudomonadota bacterium]
MKTVSMKLDAGSRSAALNVGPSGSDEYSWGTRISLGKAELEKLGLLADLPEVGDEVSFTGVGRVVAASVSASENSGETMSVE